MIIILRDCRLVVRLQDSPCLLQRPVKKLHPHAAFPHSRRQALHKNLKGCSAFPDAEKAKRHQERWAEIRRQHREERLEQADEAQEEVTGDEKANV